MPWPVLIDLAVITGICYWFRTERITSVHGAKAALPMTDLATGVAEATLADALSEASPEFA